MADPASDSEIAVASNALKIFMRFPVFVIASEMVR
jgi:hypothetical protein